MMGAVLPAAVGRTGPAILGKDPEPGKVPHAVGPARGQEWKTRTLSPNVRKMFAWVKPAPTTDTFR